MPLLDRVWEKREEKKYRTKHHFNNFISAVYSSDGERARLELIQISTSSVEIGGAGPIPVNFVF
jgi:hypothetical protein